MVSLEQVKQFVNKFEDSCKERYENTEVRLVPTPQDCVIEVACDGQYNSSWRIFVERDKTTGELVPSFVRVYRNEQEVRDAYAKGSNHNSSS